MKINKKYLIGLSALACLVPLAIVVSCDGSKKDGNNALNNSTNNGTSNNSSNDGALNNSSNNGASNNSSNGGALNNGIKVISGSMAEGYIKNNTATDYTSSTITKTTGTKILFNGSVVSIEINKKSADAVDQLIGLMNSYNDYQWHTIGLPMVDGINAVRFSIMRSAQGDNKARDLMKTYISSVFPQQYSGTTSDPQMVAADQINFETKAYATINDWLNGKRKTPLISSSMTIDWDQHPISDAELSKMEALRLDGKLMSITQYRTNQIEWFGKFDEHNRVATNNEIKFSPAAKGNWNAPKIVAPAIWDQSKMPNYSENFIFNYDATGASDARAINPKASQTNIYDAMATAASTLYDQNDASLTTGHRENLFSPQYDSFGYSKVISDLSQNPWPFLFTATSDNAEYREMTDTAVSTLIKELDWVKKIWGDEMVQYLISNNISSHAFIKHELNIKGNLGGQALSDCLNKITAIKATSKNEWFNKALAEVESNFSATTTFSGDKTPTKINDYDLSLPPTVSIYRKVPVDVLSVRTNEFDLLGTETFMTYLDGAESNDTFAKLLK